MKRMFNFFVRFFNGKKMREQKIAQEKQQKKEKYVLEYKAYKTMIAEAERPNWMHIFRLEDIRQNLHASDLEGVMLCDEAIMTFQSRASLLSLVTSSEIKKGFSWNHTHVEMAMGRLGQIVSRSYNDVILSGVLKQINELETLRDYYGYSYFIKQVTEARGINEFLRSVSPKLIVLSDAVRQN